MSTTKSDELLLKHIQRTFISGCHILHYQRVLDAYGHLSVRHPHDPTTFIMSRYIAPGTISSPLDLVVYHVSDASPVDPSSPPGYSERCIHSETYKRYPGVHAVIHSHSEAVVPYSVSGVPIQPCYHMAGFLGTRTPIWDIGKLYKEGDRRDMLVRDTRLGASLAESFEDTGDEKIAKGRDGEPPNSVVLMRGHGYSVCAKTIEDCVLRAIYTQKNAEIQTTALLTRSAYLGGSNGVAAKDDGLKRSEVAGGLAVLSEEETEGAMEMTLWSAHRPWRLWVREVEAQGMYVNLVI
ncbi:arad-like aldolase/epimerase [Viridothelium virens]|uniref:Arad-like aldolase/epimerase n=1 Tax=Viridothelium virens TaxID=1048519 RepID=A0A6A6HP63_VIRVR|nr:arad-like aldolase/epimerase [Viridothelium virens]